MCGCWEGGPLVDLLTVLHIDYRLLFSASVVLKHNIMHAVRDTWVIPCQNQRKIKLISFDIPRMGLPPCQIMADKI